MSDEDIVVHTYEECGPQRLSQKDIERMKRYAKDEGITSGKMFMHGFYPAIRVTCDKYRSKLQAGRKSLVDNKSETTDDGHLTSVGHDTSGGDKS